MGDWEFLPMCHYGFNQLVWRQTRERFSTAAQAREAGTDGPRVLVEIRNDWSAAHFIQNLRAWPCLV